MPMKYILIEGELNEMTFCETRKEAQDVVRERRASVERTNYRLFEIEAEIAI